MKALIVSSHPDLASSFANRQLLDSLKTALPAAEHLHLDTVYPNGHFAVAEEQKRLLAADLIILQFPVFWFSVPGLMKLWIDEVFTHGFAHGSKGTHLKGKKVILSYTSGAPASLYQHDGLMEHTLDEFLFPIVRWIKHCNMELLGSVYSDGVSYLAPEAERQATQLRLQSHAAKVSALAKSLA